MRIGFDVVDQIQDSEETIRHESEGARSPMFAFEEDAQKVLTFDVGVS